MTVPATQEDFDIFDSLRASGCPPGHFVGDGLRVVRRMIDRGVVTRLLCTAEWTARLGLPEGVEVRVATKEQMDRLVGFRLHQGLMALGRIPDPGPRRGTFHVALDGLANAENVGSVLRACAAFGVEGVIVGPRSASPWLRRAVRVSIAAPLHVPVHFVEDLAEAVRPLNAWAAHIHGERRDFRIVDCSRECCIVMGGEAEGVTPPVLAACRGTVYIPMAEGWDCLNVGASAAVLLAEVQRQRLRLI